MGELSVLTGETERVMKLTSSLQDWSGHSLVNKVQGYESGDHRFKSLASGLADETKPEVLSPYGLCVDGTLNPSSLTSSLSHGVLYLQVCGSHKLVFVFTVYLLEHL